MPRKDKPIDLPSDKEPERPLECSECKKPISVHYTEIVGDMIVRTAHCADCPVLKNKLYGMPYVESGKNLTEIGAGLACGNCGTTLEAIKVGTPLGCSNCYEVFDEILLQEMLGANKVPPRLASLKKSMPYHIGRGPGEVKEISPSLRLLALNEALNEMLKSEDYEQAAWLRDQIKALTEKNPEKTDERK